MTRRMTKEEIEERTRKLAAILKLPLRFRVVDWFTSCKFSLLEVAVYGVFMYYAEAGGGWITVLQAFVLFLFVTLVNWLIRKIVLGEK